MPQSDRRLIEAAAAAEYAVSLAEFNAKNAQALGRLRAAGTVAIRRFDDAMLRRFAGISEQAVAEAASGDRLSRRIHESYRRFRASIREWSDISEAAYLGIRGLG